ncbi:hypothetical protein [Devosia epidermidihirudinis]|nr:hypothetical protein [Devosia epidermidihirudinis]
MKTLTIASVLAVATMAVAPTLAMADTQILGRSEAAIERALIDNGVAVTSVEEWGGYIRAFVSNGNGGSTMAFFDADTLQPVLAPQG